MTKLLKQQLALMIKDVIPEEMGIVTITDVEVTADFKNATIFISCYEKKYEKAVFEKLNIETKNFQHILGRKLKMRYTPKLEFKVDIGIEKINRLDEILEDINKKKK